MLAVIYDVAGGGVEEGICAASKVLPALEQYHLGPCPAQLDRGGKAGETAADDDDLFAQSIPRRARRIDTRALNWRRALHSLEVNVTHPAESSKTCSLPT